MSIATERGDQQTYAKVGDDWIPVLHLLNLGEGDTVEIATRAHKAKLTKIGDDWIPVATLVDDAGDPLSVEGVAEDAVLATGFTPKSGRYYGMITSIAVSNFTTLAITANRLYAIPILCYEDMPIDRIGVNLTIAGGAGTLLRMGAARMAANGHDPGDLIFDAGTVAADGSIGDREITVAQTLPFGWSWLLLHSDGTPTLRSTTISIHGRNGLSALNASIPRMAQYKDTAFAPLPASFGPATNDDQTNIPALMVRAV